MRLFLAVFPRVKLCGNRICHDRIRLKGVMWRGEFSASHKNRIALTGTYMKENDMADESSSGLGWFLAGLGIGALVGVLYAPKSGRETRDDLAAQARDAKEKAGQYVDQGKEQLNTAVDQSKEQLGNYADKGRDYYEKGRTQWSQYVDKGKDFLAEQQDKVTSAVDAGKQAYQEQAGGSTNS